MAGRALLLAVSLLFVSLAGCSSEYAAELEPLDRPRAAAAKPITWAYEAGGDLLDEPESKLGASFRLTGRDGAEPNIGVTKSGAVFVSSYDTVLRTTDERRYEAVYDFEPTLGTGGTETADPMLWVDPVTDIVYASHMFPSLTCLAAAWSEDDGETWTTNEATCTTPGLDHQKFVTGLPGPAAPPVAGLEHPTVLYQCYQRVFTEEDPTGALPRAGFATYCNMSYDGGRTWPAETLSAVRIPGVTCGGINGHPATGPDGTIVVPVTRGCDGLYVSVSLDSGLTWTVRPGPKSVGAESIDPDLAFTPDGTLYALWRGTDHLPYLARTTDLGLTWEGPWRVSAPHVTSTVFQAISAGSDGRVAMAFLATNDTTAEPSLAPEGTRWHLHLVTSEDADGDAPSLRAVQATQPDDPVQTGCVWLYGGGHPCRNMLDFIDSAAGPDGTFRVAFTKGCGAGCTHDDDKTSHTAVAKLTGWSLLERT